MLISRSALKALRGALNILSNHQIKTHKKDLVVDAYLQKQNKTAHRLDVLLIFGSVIEKSRLILMQSNALKRSKVHLNGKR